MLNIMHLAALVASHQKCPKREVILSFPLIFLSVSWSGRRLYGCKAPVGGEGNK